MELLALPQHWHSEPHQTLPSLSTLKGEQGPWQWPGSGQIFPASHSDERGFTRLICLLGQHDRLHQLLKVGGSLLLSAIQGDSFILSICLRVFYIIIIKEQLDLFLAKLPDHPHIGDLTPNICNQITAKPSNSLVDVILQTRNIYGGGWIPHSIWSDSGNKVMTMTIFLLKH